jgi:hypothetical protein
MVGRRTILLYVVKITSLTNVSPGCAEDRCGAGRCGDKGGNQADAGQRRDVGPSKRQSGLLTARTRSIETPRTTVIELSWRE